MTTFTRARWLAGSATAVLVTLAGCDLPGTATLTFEGALVGTVDGPTVKCPAPGEESDAYATWRWSGQLNGRPVTVSVAALRSASYPDTLLIDADSDRWGAMPPTSPTLPGRGTLNAHVDADGVLHVEAQAVAFAAPASGTVTLRGSLRCPKK